MEPEIAELLRDAMDALNEIPNHKLTGAYPDSYAVSSAIHKQLRAECLEAFKQGVRDQLDDSSPDRSDADRENDEQYWIKLPKWALNRKLPKEAYDMGVDIALKGGV